MPRNKNKKKNAQIPEVGGGSAATAQDVPSSSISASAISPSSTNKRAKKRRRSNRSDGNSAKVNATKAEANVDSQPSASRESDSNVRGYSDASTSTVQATDPSHLQEISTSETDLTTITASETERETDGKSGKSSEESDKLPAVACRSAERRKGKRRMSDRSATSECDPTEIGDNAQAEMDGDHRVNTDGQPVPCSPTVKENQRKDKGRRRMSGGSANSAENGQPNATNEQELKRADSSSLIAELELLKKELHHKDDMIHEMQRGSKKLRAAVSCLICLEIMANPFTVACGHTTCYECLTDWLKQKGECPVCRVPIDKPPVLSFSIRDLAENVLDCLNSDERAVQKQKMAEKIALLRGITDYFPGMFSGAVTIIDDEDEGTRRCSRCTWEVVGNVCTGCGEIFPDLPSENEYPDYEDDEMYGDDYDDTDTYDSDFVVADDAIEYDYAADGLGHPWDGHNNGLEMTYMDMDIYGDDYDTEAEEQYSDSDSDPGNFGSDHNSFEGPISSGLSDRGESSPTHYSANEEGGYESNISDVPFFPEDREENEHGEYDPFADVVSPQWSSEEDFGEEEESVYGGELPEFLLSQSTHGSEEEEEEGVAAVVRKRRRVRVSSDSEEDDE